MVTTSTASYIKSFKSRNPVAAQRLIEQTGCRTVRHEGEEFTVHAPTDKAWLLLQHGLLGRPELQAYDIPND